MGDENPIRTLGDYSKPSHEGYRNTIELPKGNNVVPLRSDTIRLVQNRFLFHGLRSEDPNQHLKDFLKLVDSLDLNGDNRIYLHMGGSYYSFPCSILSTGKDRKTSQRTIDQSAGGKLRDRNTEESWALLEDLALYYNESWKDPREFEVDFKQQQSKMTNKIDTVLKAITDRMTGALPSDTVKNPKLNVSPITSVLSARSYQMEDPQCSSQVQNSINAITTCSNQHNESHPSTDKTLTVNEVGTSKSKEPKHTLEDEFKDLHLNLPVLEVLAHAPIYNAMLDKYVGSLELGKNRYAFIQGEMPKQMEDPGLFTLPCSLGDSEPFDTLADLGSCVKLIPIYLFNKLKIGLLEETDHVFGLADGTKSYPVGIVKDVEVHIGRLKLLNDFYVIDMKKDPEIPLLVGRGFLATASAVIDCRKARIAVGEGIMRSVFGVKETDPGSQTPYYARKEFMDCHLPGECEMARDAKINPFKDVLVFRRMVEFLGALPINLKGNTWESDDLIEKLINWNKPPKDGDGAWHAKIRIIDPDGEEFTRTFQSIPTSRKLSEKENPRETIDLDHFPDTLYYDDEKLEVSQKFHG
ncbi:MAK10-like protein [Tanacetum coccineum]